MSNIPGTGDQADTLRQMAHNAKKIQQADSVKTGGLSDHNGIRVISVTSGKGGVGKSNVVSNLAIALSAQGKKVLLIDADLGLGNLDVLLGLSPTYNLNHVMSGEKTVLEILIDGPAGIKIIPAGTGVQELTSLGQHEKLKLLDELDMLEEQFDIMIIDTEAGISENVTYFTVAAQEIFVVVTPEPTSITDAYALIKLLATRYSEHHFKVLVNMAKDSEDALEVFRKLANVAGRFLNISLDYLGCVVKDEKVVEAVKRQKAVTELFPDSEASACFATLARRVIDNKRQSGIKGNIQFFFRRMMDNQGAR
ncbi:MAG: flagellar synthesis regulator FleN [Geobacteraceae bacterium GWC2_55_20]|nr:MAG: flagellar synthesis regulator FleN [Geobacteraceae bacterium GWC2_55_20]OGU19041.1 MAG: flagellar synthesis regulator FleN [Geobacteraceae bacterium GWF2_54_21]HBA71168.1 flagellar synthesis regulator FleN [Geobacter sp.]HCE69575.1 flagellar synthesis regulator FleN [Geobacter sp.]